MTAGTALERSAEPSAGLVEALSAIAGDGSADVVNRLAALTAPSGLTHLERLAVSWRP